MSVKRIKKLMVNKIKGFGGYDEVFDIGFPTRFYFNKDGSFDGIEVSVEGGSERDNLLVRELCLKLARATGITHYYKAESDDENDER